MNGGGGSLEDRFGELSCARIVELITDYLQALADRGSRTSRSCQYSTASSPSSQHR